MRREIRRSRAARVTRDLGKDEGSIGNTIAADEYRTFPGERQHFEARAPGNHERRKKCADCGVVMTVGRNTKWCLDCEKKNHPSGWKCRQTRHRKTRERIERGLAAMVDRQSAGKSHRANGWRPRQGLNRRTDDSGWELSPAALARNARYKAAILVDPDAVL